MRMFGTGQSAVQTFGYSCTCCVRDSTQRTISSLTRMSASTNSEHHKRVTVSVEDDIDPLVDQQARRGPWHASKLFVHLSYLLQGCGKVYAKLEVRRHAMIVVYNLVMEAFLDAVAAVYNMHVPASRSALERITGTGACVNKVCSIWAYRCWTCTVIQSFFCRSEKLT